MFLKVKKQYLHKRDTFYLNKTEIASKQEFLTSMKYFKHI